MVQTKSAGVWKLKYSWSRSRFSALSTVQREHRTRRMGQNLKHGRSSMESHGRPFSSRWRSLCSSSMAFRKMQRCCRISWRRTTSQRWSSMCGLCATRCQRWSWANPRMCRSTHPRSRGMWTTSTSAPTVRLVAVQCQRASTATIWCRVYQWMMIGGFSPSWCTTKSTPWPTNRRRLSRRRKPTKRGISRKSTWTASDCKHWLRNGEAARSGIQSLLESSRSHIIAVVREMVVVRRVRSIAAGILRSATGAIRWGTLHGNMQALHRWRAEQRQRQRQR